MSEPVSQAPLLCSLGPRITLCRPRVSLICKHHHCKPSYKENSLRLLHYIRLCANRDITKYHGGFEARAGKWEWKGWVLWEDVFLAWKMGNTLVWCWLEFMIYDCILCQNILEMMMCIFLCRQHLLPSSVLDFLSPFLLSSLIYSLLSTYSGSLLFPSSLSPIVFSLLSFVAYPSFLLSLLLNLSLFSLPPSPLLFTSLLHLSLLLQVTKHVPLLYHFSDPFSQNF